jgi:hypothetical protein
MSELGERPLRVASAASTMDERLERGEVIYYPDCPFAMPAGADRDFLLKQRLASRAHKNISYNPHSGKAGGFRPQGAEQAERLRSLLAEFSANATKWLKSVLPGYADHWRSDAVSFRPVEEATRRLRFKARNDLLHVDAFPSRPTNGDRILRLFVNINPTEPRIWATSEGFARLLERFGKAAGLPSNRTVGRLPRLREGLLRLFDPKRRRRTVYDQFMLRFHDYLKRNETFQESGPKRFWSFPPGSSWLVFTDFVSHAALRGRFALEHSYFVPARAMTLPEMTPAALLERACGVPVLQRAA